MADIETINGLLNQSLIAGTAKQADLQLHQLSGQAGFFNNLLLLIDNGNIDLSIRLAGSLFLKNLVKKNWVDEDGNYKLNENDVSLIRSSIINLMIQSPIQIQFQIGEIISIIAESDFPSRWSNLIDDLIARLDDTNFQVNKAILIVMHSIFKRWRPLFRSDELFLEIKLVLDKFASIFLQLLVKVDKLIDSCQVKNELDIYLDTLLLLVKIYYDLNCQDIPEFFEDNLNVGMSIIHKYLTYTSSLVEDASEDEEVNIVIKIKTSIVELIQLYVVRYEDVFEPLIQQFIQTVWSLLTLLSNQIKNDLLISKSLSFMISIIKLPNYKNLFSNEESVKEITEKIIIPNIKLRPVDEELFEDDPIEFIRRDLEGSDVDSRRKSSIEFLKELKETNEPLVTEIILKYIENFLNLYKQNPSQWHNKDIAIYLFSSLATKGTITNNGVSSTNLLLDVVSFFTSNIAPDLVDSSTNPILKIDSIKYIYIFRNQLTKDQILSTFPLLVAHLNHENYVVYTYSAITIEKLLSIKNNNEFMFNKDDISSFIQPILNSLFKIILSQSAPEKLSENEFLIKCILKVLVIGENSISEYKFEILDKIIKIIEIISKNPSNPRFNHYCFETISIIIKYNTNSTAQFIEIILPSLLAILAQDVQEFVPYTFQILSFLLESFQDPSLPSTYKDLIKPLLSPAVWEYTGNIPGITRLLIAILNKDYTVFNSPESLTPLLGVFQKLIASRNNDIYGLDLLTNIFIAIPLTTLQPFLNQVGMLLLQRLQSSRTEKYVRRLTVFLMSLASVDKLGPSFVIHLIDSVQDGLFGQILSQFLLPSIKSIGNLLDKKIILAGFSSLLLDNELSRGKYNSYFIPTLSEVLTAMSTESLHGIKSDVIEIGEIDELSFGSSFNKLSSIQSKTFDPLDKFESNKVGFQKVVKMNMSRLDNAVLVGAANQLSNENQVVLQSLLS